MHKITTLAPPKGLVTGAPRVRLLAYTENAYDLAIASARTCYAPELKTVADVNEKLREGLGKAIYNAGHHTPFQHPTFVFSLEQVSRHFVWSFLHSHPYYNSEQQSQRYVRMDRVAVHVPDGLNAEARRIFEDAARRAWSAYDKIGALLEEDVFRTMHAIGRIKGQSDKKIQAEAQKKSIETARYVIPIAAHTSLYHTLSGIELKRYARMAEVGDTPAETSAVIGAMLDAVRAVEPDFVERIQEEPMPRSEVVESVAEQAAGATRPGGASDGDAWARAFDARLDGLESRLVAYDPGAEAQAAAAAREVLGLAPDAVSDDEAILLLMDPAQNPHHHDTLNTWSHSPLMRALNHVHYTFKKRMSHTADSQEQRHRTIPATRPLLSRVHTRVPDYHTPEILEKNAEALALYHETMATLWDAKNTLIDTGVPPEQAVYILPNAVRVRYTASGNLLGYLHKWRLRTCFNAQREIYEHAMQELAQVQAVHPRLGAHIGPPCMLRVHDKASWAPKEGPCPEGAQWCGVKVWTNFPKVKRPF